MYKDWCPLCGKRFQEQTPEKVINQILGHLKEGKDGKSECENNWRPLDIVLKDYHY